MAFVRSIILNKWQVDLQAELFRNRKGYFSINVQVTGDVRFVRVKIGNYSCKLDLYKLGIKNRVDSIVWKYTV